jgi:hypothetical protein
MKRYATIQRHDTPRFAGERSLPKAWSRRAGRTHGDMPVKDNQVIRGLVVGLPLAFALWIVLALLVWVTF